MHLLPLLHLPLLSVVGSLVPPEALLFKPATNLTWEPALFAVLKTRAPSPQGAGEKLR